MRRAIKSSSASDVTGSVRRRRGGDYSEEALEALGEAQAQAQFETAMLYKGRFRSTESSELFDVGSID